MSFDFISTLSEEKERQSTLTVRLFTRDSNCPASGIEMIEFCLTDSKETMQTLRSQSRQSGLL